MASLYYKYWIQLAWLLMLPFQVNSIYVHIRGEDRKCYIEEIPDDTLVTGGYRLEPETWNKSSLSTSSDGHAHSRMESVLEGLHIQVYDPRGSIVLSKVYGTKKGRFTFTSHTHGEHKVCYAMKRKKLTGVQQKYRLHLDVQVGGHAVDYDVVSRKEKLTDIQLRIRKLLDHTDQISKSQTYQRQREARFRETSESTNRRVLVFAFIQTFILLTMGYYHVHNLKAFFITKKLV